MQNLLSLSPSSRPFDSYWLVFQLLLFFALLFIFSPFVILLFSSLSLVAGLAWWVPCFLLSLALVAYFFSRRLPHDFPILLFKSVIALSLSVLLLLPHGSFSLALLSVCVLTYSGVLTIASVIEAISMYAHRDLFNEILTDKAEFCFFMAKLLRCIDIMIAILSVVLTALFLSSTLIFPSIALGVILVVLLVTSCIVNTAATVFFRILLNYNFAKHQDTSIENRVGHIAERRTTIRIDIVEHKNELVSDEVQPTPPAHKDFLAVSQVSQMIRAEKMNNPNLTPNSRYAETIDPYAGDPYAAASEALSQNKLLLPPSSSSYSTLKND